MCWGTLESRAGLPPVTAASNRQRRWCARSGRMAVIRRTAQVVGRSTIRAAAIPFRLGREVPQGRCHRHGRHDGAGAVTPSAGTESGSAWIVVVRTVPGQRFDGTVEPVTGRAPDHAAFDGPVG